MKFLCFIVLFTVSYSRSPFPDHTDNKFQDDCLSAHNKYRTKHHAPPLRESAEAVQYAKSRCQLISESELLKHGHKGLKGYGENIFWGGGLSAKSILKECSRAINGWYSEEKKYDYNNPGFGMSTGHFTQLVWKYTTVVGCARCGGKGSQWFETYIVCNYSPRGNYQGRFPQNVLRP